MSQLLSSFELKPKLLVLPLGILLALVVGWLTARVGIAIPGLLMALAFAIPFLIVLFHSPRIGVIAVVSYCFLLFLTRELSGNIPYGMGVDGVLVLTWVAVAFTHDRYDWSYIKNDLCLVGAIWFVINILEIGNPAGSSFQGWYQEMRSTTLYWFLSVPLVMLLFHRKQDLNIFLYLIIGLSVLGALNGLKQLYIGLFPGEAAFLAENTKTHLLWGKLRVFSFYSDAGQFGASQAHIALIAIILALGPFQSWKRVLLAIAAVILIIGMFISGTRGALFALMIGVAFALLISKNIKVLIIGSVLAGAAFGVLKYTKIGDSNYNIYRMRTALDPEDASFNVRLQNQLTLSNYLSTRPFGGGVGSIGNSGIHYNAGKFLSAIPPDSYWVKVWAMYGIVGFVIWLGIMLYILGKCCGIVWNIRDPLLRTKLIALTSGFAGILFCSYGNEVINFMPSAIVVYVSWAFIFLGPKLDSNAESVVHPLVNS